jgi:hypothetical protein
MHSDKKRFGCLLSRLGYDMTSSDAMLRALIPVVMCREGDTSDYAVSVIDSVMIFHKAEALHVGTMKHLYERGDP